MSSHSKQLQADVCVVGAGIVGLAHAFAALERGLSVVVLDRDRPAVGASVRNFGHVFVTGQADGQNFEMALRARERWLALAGRAGLHLLESGTLLLARGDDELAVLEETAADPSRRMQLLTARQATEHAPVAGRGLAGGARTSLDLRVNPRAAVAGLAALLERSAGATLRWGSRVHHVEPGVVHADAAVVKAPVVIVCPGPDYRDLPPALAPGLEQLTRCRLQMLRVASPGGRSFTPAIATGLSLIRYPAFAGRQAAAALRARLERERPELLSRGIHLLITQLPDGDLIVGDSHTYGDTLDAFGDERIDALLLAEAASVLGVERLEVRERWHGIYASRAGGAQPSPEPFLVTAPMPGVRVVENVVGLGMTLSFGYADTVIGEALADR